MRSAAPMSAGDNTQEPIMITIHGVPISVHVRKAVVTAIYKNIDHRVEPVIPFDPPANWTSLSPTGLIPAIQDGDFSLAESSAICLYMQRKQRRLLALHIEADGGGFREREIAVLDGRNQPRWTERGPIRRRIERNHRLDPVIDVLVDRRDDRLSHVDGNRNAVDRNHDWLLGVIAGRHRRSGSHVPNAGCVRGWVDG